MCKWLVAYEVKTDDSDFLKSTAGHEVKSIWKCSEPKRPQLKNDFSVFWTVIGRTMEQDEQRLINIPTEITSFVSEAGFRIHQSLQFLILWSRIGHWK